MPEASRTASGLPPSASLRLPSIEPADHLEAGAAPRSARSACDGLEGPGRHLEPCEVVEACQAIRCSSEPGEPGARLGHAQAAARPACLPPSHAGCA